MIDQSRPFTKEEKQFIYKNYGVKGAEWCAMRLKRKLVHIQAYTAKQRMRILDGVSDEIYAQYVGPKRLNRNARRRWSYE